MRLGIVLLSVVTLAVATPARAQEFDAPGSDIIPQTAGCTYTFTSGSGASLFTWCLSTGGNVVRFITPAGQNHIFAEQDGYAVCSAAGVHGSDLGTVIPVAFGPPTVLAGCTAGSSCTIQRDTTDGAFRLVQKFTRTVKEFELNVDHTLTNISGGTIDDVVLMRFAHFGVDNDIGDDRGDRSPRSGWMADVERLGLTAHTTTQPADTFIINNFPTGCVGPAVATPAPPGNYAVQVNYRLGNMASLKKKVVRVQYRRD